MILEMAREKECINNSSMSWNRTKLVAGFFLEWKILDGSLLKCIEQGCLFCNLARIIEKEMVEKYVNGRFNVPSSHFEEDITSMQISDCSVTIRQLHLKIIDTQSGTLILFIF